MPMTNEEKEFIDSASYYTLLDGWRYSPTGDPMFTGETGQYYSKVMAEKRIATGDNGVSASKSIGWERK